jgi:hypothetical protein
MKTHLKSTAIKDLCVILVCVVLVRVVFIWLMPDTYAVDMHAWPNLIDGLNQGKNPYAADLFNYPPFWIQVVYALNKASMATGITLIRLVQVVLILSELMVLLLVRNILTRYFQVPVKVSAYVLFFAVNPILILLNCQHGNIDIIVALWILLCVQMVLAFQRGKSPVDWLMACFFLGMGVLTKTIPVMVAPLLLIGVRRLPLNVVLFGFTLFLMPVVLGMSIVYVLEPDGVTRNVLAYRSLAGWYGITGILNLLNANGVSEVYKKLSPWLMSSMLLSGSWLGFRTRDVSKEDIVRIATLMLVFIPTFGPGYSPPYILWFLPLLFLLFYASPTQTRRVLIAGFIVTACTYTVEYAFFNSHGAFMAKLIPTAQMQELCDSLGARQSQIKIRLPMFIFYVSMFVLVLRDLFRSLSAARQ